MLMLKMVRLAPWLTLWILAACATADRTSTRAEPALSQGRVESDHRHLDDVGGCPLECCVDRSALREALHPDI